MSTPTQTQTTLLNMASEILQNASNYIDSLSGENTSERERLINALKMHLEIASVVQRQLMNEANTSRSFSEHATENVFELDIEAQIPQTMQREDSAMTTLLKEDTSVPLMTRQNSMRATYVEGCYHVFGLPPITSVSEKWCDEVDEMPPLPLLTRQTSINSHSYSEQERRT